MIQKISEDLLWGQIVARAWCDEGLMKRLLSDPRGVLSEHGLEVPEGMDVRVEQGAEVKMGMVQIEPILGNTTDHRRPHLMRCVSTPGRLAPRLFSHETCKPEQR